MQVKVPEIGVEILRYAQNDTLIKRKEVKMDPIKILKRAWHILWSYRALWVFGLILAMAGAGSSGGNGSNSGSRYEANSQSNQQH